HECEYDIPDVGAVANAPVLQHHAGHDPEPIERQVTAGEGELPAGDVAAFVEALLAVFEGGEHKEICALVEPRLSQPDAVHDPVPKRQLSHSQPPSEWRDRL